MSKVIINGSAGGTGSDECTARLSDVPAGLKAVTADSNDEAGAGTMTMTGNAQAGHVLAGETFYTNDYKTKQTGAMTVGSLLSFSVAAYSGKRLLAKWQNPNQAAGKPYSGVMIRYSTSEYPGAAGGTQIYKGAGNNTAAGGWSQAFLDMPALNTTYYFSCVPYVTCSAGEMVGAPINFACKTGADLWLTFTAGRNYTVPEGYTLMDAFAVGGGGGGGGGHCGMNRYYISGGGGGGGYTSTVRNIAISGRQILNIIVGAGGAGGILVGNRGGQHAIGQPGGEGGPSSIVRSNIVLCNALGGGAGNGHGAATRSAGYGADGGSGGANCKSNGNTGYRGLNGGSDGSDSEVDSVGMSGVGQKSTTRAWGNTNGTLYSGGGGSGANGATWSNGSGGAGGAGGGGSGGNGAWETQSESGEYTTHWATSGYGGANNTGGGGGGGGAGFMPGMGSQEWNGASGSAGGSGIVLLHLY